MAKIIQFDPSRNVRPKYYTPEALRGRLLRFKFRTALAESASIAAASDAARYLEGRNSTNTKIS